MQVKHEHHLLGFVASLNNIKSFGIISVIAYITPCMRAHNFKKQIVFAITFLFRSIDSFRLFVESKVFNDGIEALRISYKKMNPFCVPFATTNMGSAILAMDLVSLNLDSAMLT